MNDTTIDQFRDDYMQCLIDAQYEQMEKLQGKTREDVGKIDIDVLVHLQMQDLQAVILRWMELQKADLQAKDVEPDFAAIMANLCALLAPPDMLTNPDRLMDNIENTTQLADVLIKRVINMVLEADKKSAAH